MVVLEALILFLIIVSAAAMLSHGAEMIAEKYGPNFAGSIILAFVTTLPEYMFVFWASLKGAYDVALGSAVGAATMLVTLGYGMVILTATTKLSRKPVKVIRLSRATRIDALYLAATAIVAYVLAYIGDGFSLIDGVLLFVIFFAYVVHLALAAREFGRRHLVRVSRERFIKGTGYLIIGGAVTVVVSERFVEAMISLALAIGVSPVAIAIIIGPLASELPEKLTAFLTVMRNAKLAEISVANFIGSKVNHNSVLLGTMPIIAYATGNGSVTGVISPQFTAMTLLTFIAGISVARRRLERWQGFFFTALYAVPLYIAYTVR
jgi:cation:H+ antiporter